MGFFEKGTLGSFTVIMVLISFGTDVVEAQAWIFWQAPPTSASCRSPVPFADTADCTSYYQCFQVGAQWELVHLTCPPGGIWDDMYKSCVEGMCGATTITTTTTAPAVTTTTKPTTKQPITPAPITTKLTTKPPGPPPPTPMKTSPQFTTTTSTTTKSPPIVPPSPTPPPSGGTCPYDGFFPDPVNCRGYYRCVLIQGRFYKYDYLCPIGSSWSTLYGKCALSNCLFKKSRDKNNMLERMKS